MTADGNQTFSAFLLRFLLFGSSAVWSAFFVGGATPVSGVSVNFLDTPRQTDTHKISMSTRPIQAAKRSTHGAHTSGFNPKSIPSSDFRKTRPDDRISRTYPVICSAFCETTSCQPGAIAIRYVGTGGWPFTKSVFYDNFKGKRHCFGSPSPACHRWLRLLLLLWLRSSTVKDRRADTSTATSTGLDLNSALGLKHWFMKKCWMYNLFYFYFIAITRTASYMFIYPV